MGVIALVVLGVGFLGTILSYFNIAMHAYREQGPGWGLLCLLVPNVNLVWGIVHWSDDDSRKVFLKYLGYCGLFILGMLLSGASAETN